MKSYLKLLSVFFIGLVNFQSNAQITYGVKTGFNFASISADNISDTKMRLAYQIGGVVDYALSEELSFQPGLMITGKGTGLDVGGDGYGRIVLSYLELPLNVAYKVDDFQLYAGPYLAFGLNAKSKWSDGDNKESEKINLTFGEVDPDSNDEELNAFDYGLSFGAAYQTGPVLISLGYSLGLGNLTPKVKGYEDYAKDNKINNRVVSLSVSYFFGEL